MLISKVNFIHSHTQQPLIQDLNNTNKYNAKKTHFSYINNSNILKSLVICPFLVGSHGRDNFKGLINYEDVFRLDGYCI